MPSDFEAIRFKAGDGRELQADLYLPERPKACIQLHPGTVIPKSYYRSFSGYLATKGFAVLLFDYRGVGSNQVMSLKDDDSRIFDWARYDMSGALDYLTRRFPALPRFVFGHSMGGQIIGLMPNCGSIHGIYTVASSTGNWKNFSGSMKWTTAFSWYTVFPLTTTLLGYFPASKLGMGPDWPKGVSTDWQSFCVGNHNMTTLATKKSIPTHFEQIKCPFKAVYLKDDVMATPKTIERFQSDYQQAQIEVASWDPNDFGMNQIGHHGFFKQKSSNKMWEDAVNWYEQLLQ